MTCLYRAFFAGGLLALIVGCGGVDSAADFAESSGLAELDSELSTNKASRYLPLESGNRWILDSTSSNASRVVYVERTVSGDALVYGLTEAGAAWLTTSRATATLHAWNDDKAQYSPFVRFSYVSSSWTFEGSASACDRLTGKRRATDVTLSTPAGIFESARTIGFTSGGAASTYCPVAYVSEATFVPDVGVVSMVSGNGERFLLRTARVGTKTYPEEKLFVSATSDRTSYTNTDTQTANAVLKLSVTNGFGAFKVFQFGTSQQFDFELLTSSGRLVRKWSDGRTFGQSSTQFSLAPGQTKSFIGEVLLVDRFGQKLNGTYKVRGKLMNSSSGDPTSPAVTIKVQRARQ